MRYIPLILFSFVCFVSSGSAQQNPDGVLPLHTTNQPYLFLVRDPVVQDDLNLTPQQKSQLQQVNDELDMSMWSMRNKPPQEVARIMAETTKKTHEKLSTLLSPEQNRRIAQIELWVLGMKSLMRKDVADGLNLDPQQRSNVKDILTTSQEKMNSLRKQLQAGGDAADLNKQYRETQLKQQKDILDLLTPEQQQSWVGVLGKRVDVQKLGRIRFKAPDIDSGSGWINSEPLTLDKLKGKVVALHFYAFA